MEVESILEQNECENPFAHLNSCLARETGVRSNKRKSLTWTLALVIGLAGAHCDA